MGYRDVVLRYFDMWNSGDTTGIDDIIDPDWIDHAHPDIRGPGGVRDSIVAIKSAQPRLHFHLDHVLDDTDMIAVAGSVHGASTRLMWLIRIRAGRMAEMWTYRGVDA
jgi:ketosteroid isomerase-like protein